MIQKPRHIVEVIFDRLGPGLYVLAVRVALFGDLLVDPLVQQFRGHLVVELVVEPTDQTAHFQALHRVAGQQGCLWAGLFDILTNRGAFRHHDPVKPQHRHLARRIAAQEIGVLLPIAFLDQFHLDLLLPKAKPHLATEGGQGNVKQASRHIKSVWLKGLHSSMPAGGGIFNSRNRRRDRPRGWSPPRP